MSQDFSKFDQRGYKTVSAKEGYAVWSETYDEMMADYPMDLPLLDQTDAVDWGDVVRAADLACGTGRIGAWLKSKGVQTIDGVDISPEMLDRARAKNIYESLIETDMCETGLPDDSYSLISNSLALEHVPELEPLYAEASRLAGGASHFVLMGYQPYFLLNGIPTHFSTDEGDDLAIENYVHFFSDHMAAARATGWSLVDLREQVVEEGWVALKPGWAKHLHKPVSFMCIWRR